MNRHEEEDVIYGSSTMAAKSHAVEKIIRVMTGEEEPPCDFLVPTTGRLVVKPDPFKYSGRLVIPEKYKMLPTTGTVVAIGLGVDQVKVGQRIVCGIFSGTLIKVANRPALRVLGQDEVLAIITVDDNLEEMTA